MCAPLVVMVMTSSFFNPGFALSSHFDTDGAPLSELSWSSSLAVVAVSFSGLFTFIFLMLACLCCKKGDIGFKEFENAEGEEYQTEVSTLASPASQGGPEVYVLPLTEVSRPLNKQPGRSVQLSKSTDVGRHSLLYIKEIGHGWFGKVLLGEVTCGASSMQVVVKELKSSASVQDQMHFLEEIKPFRGLQHPALLQCLAQCTEVTPYLLVMEFCPLGDVKGYLCSCRASDTMTPDPLILQRMACEIASGLLHLHKHNFVHSDLALRNCLLTSDVTVKIGDYGLSHSKYKDDYFVTSDQTWVPLRWIAPELVDDVHGNLLVADQTKQSNIWSLGVTIWELFELGNQPYRLYSDRQVLSYAVKDQQLKLPKPLLKIPLAERWYEVMQFCWLQDDQRPNAEEVHLLLSYLCAKSASEAEEDFERRWNSMRPNTTHGHHGLRGAGAMALEMAPPSASSSFPLLEQFSVGDTYHSDSGDDILTVTETSHGLNFEYKWEQARAEQSYHHSSSTGTLGQGNPHCQEIYYPPGGIVGGCGMDGLTLGVSPSYYEPKQLHAPGVVPVLSAHSPSVSSEYYIRIEEPVNCNVDMDYTSYSPEFGGSNGSFLTGSGDSAECMNCPAEVKPIDSYWAADVHKSGAYDSDNTSPALSLTMEPLLGQVSNGSPLRPWESGHYISYKDRDGGYYYEHSPPITMEGYIIGKPPEHHQESWGSRSLRQALGQLENPLGISPSLDSPRQGYGDPYLETSQGSIIGKNVTGSYYDMMGSLRKTMPNSHQVSINIETEGALFLHHGDSDTEDDDDEEDLFVERKPRGGWAGHLNTNSASLCRRQGSCQQQDAYIDFHYTMPTTDVEDCWSDEQKLAYHHPAKPIDYLEATTAKDSGCVAHGSHYPLVAAECNPYVYICHETIPDKVLPVECCQVVESPHFIDPLTGAVVRNCYISGYEKISGAPSEENKELSARGSDSTSKAKSLNKSTQYDLTEQYVDITVEDSSAKKEEGAKEIAPKESKSVIVEIPTSQTTEPSLAQVTQSEPDSEVSRTADSGIDRGQSSVSLVEIDDCSDDDITDVTSAIFGDFAVDYVETGDYTTSSPALKSLQKQVGTPDSMDSIELPSATASSEGFSPASHPSSSPKAMDSGYDTENNESPEFVLKEPHESQDPKAFVQPLGKPVISASMEEEKEETTEAAVAASISLSASQSSDGGLVALSQDIPYRDSAYFSDYDTENEKLSRDEIEKKDAKEESESQRNEEMTEVKVITSAEQTRQMEENMHVSLKDRQDDGPTGEMGDLLPQLEITNTTDTISTTTPCPSSPLHSAVEDQIESEKKSGTDEQLFTQTGVLGEGMPSEQSAKQDGFSSTQTLSCDENSKETEHSEVSEVLSPPLDNSGTISTIELTCNVKLEEYEQEQKNDKEQVSNTVSLVELPKEEEREDSKEIESSVSADASCKKDQIPQSGQEQDKEVHPKISPRASSPPPPLPSHEGRVSPADGEEADEEDADTDDSDESDEELRSYSVQEQSEESEDENHPIPIVISDCSDAHNLRSLLKMPSLVTDSSLDEPEAKKKVVSFFDDVTVYLFDQESPTRELADHGFPPGAETANHGSKVTAAHSQEKVAASDDSSDGNISEESAGFEWEDDFPLLSVGSSAIKPAPEPEPAPPKLPPVTVETKPTIQYSRFTVSPSSISRFSITHVTDSDMESAGGSSEDGDRE